MHSVENCGQPKWKDHGSTRYGSQNNYTEGFPLVRIVGHVNSSVVSKAAFSGLGQVCGETQGVWKSTGQWGSCPLLAAMGPPGRTGFETPAMVCFQNVPCIVHTTYTQIMKLWNAVEEKKWPSMTDCTYLLCSQPPKWCPLNPTEQRWGVFRPWARCRGLDVLSPAPRTRS